MLRDSFFSDDPFMKKAASLTLLFDISYRAKVFTELNPLDLSRQRIKQDKRSRVLPELSSVFLSF